MASVLPTDIFCSGGQLSLLVCYKQPAGSIVVMDTVVVSVGGDGAGGLAVVVLVEAKMQLLHRIFDQYEGCF